MLPHHINNNHHHHHHHKELTSVTDTIDFFSEQSPFYTESIQFAKQSHKNKTHIPPEERNLVFPQQQQNAKQSSTTTNNQWFDQEDSEFDFFDQQHEKSLAPSMIQEDHIFLEGGSCDFDEDMDFLNMADSAPQQPAAKKVKYEHNGSSSNNLVGPSSDMMSTTVAVKVPANTSTLAQQPAHDNLLSILIREQQKQGAEISELKQMVHNLQAQIMMHPMYQEQFMLYQQQQQQQYQLYLQQNGGHQETQ